MSTSALPLPLHQRDRDGWQDMALGDPHSPGLPRSPSKGRRPIFRLRLVRATPRVAVLLMCGGLVCLWFLFSQSAFPFGGPPFPHPHSPGPQRPFDDLDRVDDEAWYKPKPKPDVPSAPPKPKIDWGARAEKVKEAFVHAYHGYEKYAMPKDELLPLSNGSVNNFNGWAVTLVDSLDTMYLMGLHEEYERGIRYVEKQMNITAHGGTYAPFFETCIRYLGGLLSAYGLSHDAALLRRADELGLALLPAFNTSSGFPAYSVHTVSGATSGGWGGYGAQTGWLAEVASCTMEYKYLAKLTGRKEYYDAAEGVMQRIYNANLDKYPGGLLPTMWNMTNGQPVNDQISIGALADSAYEYFLKQYLLTNKTDTPSLNLYLRTARGILEHNLYLSPVRSLLYVTDINAAKTNPRPIPSRKFEHLSCFLPGLFALGASQLPPNVFESGEERQMHIWAASGLGVSCATVYSDQPSGLGPDEVMFTSRWEMEWQRVQQERAKEAQRVQEKEREKENEMNTVTGIDIGVVAGGKGQGRKPLVALPKEAVYNRPTNVRVNQSIADERLRWANVLEAWRMGRYDSAQNMYLRETGEPEQAWFYLGWDKDPDDAPGSTSFKDLDKDTAAAGTRATTDIPEVGAHGGEIGHGGAKGHGTPDKIKTAPTKAVQGPVPGLRDPPPEAPLNTVMRDYRSQNSGHYLRPETLESIFLLWRTTGDEIWRERGWAAFLALERESRTPTGYATLKNAFASQGNKGDSMPSYFLAETMKYLYLMFSEESLLPLDKYVLNTEAHPLPVFEWTAWEKEKFGIPS